MAFIKASEHTLSKDELLKEVWQGRIVSDDGITRLISDLRKQLQINSFSSFRSNDWSALTY